MANILMWIGIALTVIGWLCLGWQASKRLVIKDKLDENVQKNESIKLYRRYCWGIICIGMVLLLISILI